MVAKANADTKKTKPNAEAMEEAKKGVEKKVDGREYDFAKAGVSRMHTAVPEVLTSPDFVVVTITHTA
ncbi:hypothetical protein TSMEX_000865 [Taenia solium]